MIALPENIEIPRPSHTAQTRWALPAVLPVITCLLNVKRWMSLCLPGKCSLALARPRESLSVGIGSSSEFGSLSVTEGDSSFSILGFCGYCRLPLEEHRCV